MFSRLMPREGNFFELFNNHADRIVEGSRALALMITTFTEVEGLPGTWERRIQLCDGSGVCKRSYITAEYSLRIILVEATGTRIVFQDFTPLP